MFDKSKQTAAKRLRDRQRTPKMCTHNKMNNSRPVPWIRVNEWMSELIHHAANFIKYLLSFLCSANAIQHCLFLPKQYFHYFQLNFAPLKFNVIYIFIISTDNNKQRQKFIFITVKLQSNNELMTPNLFIVHFFFIHSCYLSAFLIPFSLSSSLGCDVVTGNVVDWAKKRGRWSVRMHALKRRQTESSVVREKMRMFLSLSGFIFVFLFWLSVSHSHEDCCLIFPFRKFEGYPIGLFVY